MDDASSSEVTRLNDDLTNLLSILTDLTLSNLRISFVRLLCRRLAILDVRSDLGEDARRLSVVFLRSTLTVRFRAAIRNYLAARTRRSAI